MSDIENNAPTNSSNSRSFFGDAIRQPIAVLSIFALATLNTMAAVIPVGESLSNESINKNCSFKLSRTYASQSSIEKVGNSYISQTTIPAAAMERCVHEHSKEGRKTESDRILTIFNYGFGGTALITLGALAYRRRKEGGNNAPKPRLA